MLDRLPFFRQATTTLRAEVGLTPDASRSLARQVADGLSGARQSIREDPVQEDEFQILENGSVVSTFALTVSRDLAELGDGEAGRRRLLVSWSGATDAHNEKMLDFERGFLFIFARLAFARVPGFATYQTFLARFQRELGTRDATAATKIETA